MKLSEILKEKTAHAHGQAEKDLPFFKVEFSSVDYANLIQRMLSLYDPLEKNFLRF